MARPTPPYFGAAYYPEDWPREQIDDDIRHMKDAGMNVMRIAEFAWSCMEPHEGAYDFEWLHHVVEKLDQAGVGVVLGPPTCTPPVWIAERYPECIVMLEDGTRIQHGTRRHACPNSPVYRDHCERIVTRMAEEFGQDDRIMAWQIDNELYISGGERGCCCPVCHRKFQESLRARFGTIDVLNEAWGTHLWSQTYESFAQIPIPKSHVWHHPSLQTAWMNFQSDSYVEFAEQQADILHSRTTQPVGTDMMPFGGIHYYKMHRKLDLVQYNHYDDMPNLWRQLFWMDYVRGVCEAPFWVTETQTCWGGGVIAAGYKEPGFCRANSWLPMALGGEANLYWLWRTHWSGQELMHGSVLTSAGRPRHIIGEVKALAQSYERASEFLNTTKPRRNEVALHFSCWAWWLFQFQPQKAGFHYLNELQSRVYRPLAQTGLRMDVVDPMKSLDGYRVLVSPLLPCLDEGDLRARLKDWIEAGGTWIVGPLSDNRTLEATKYTHSPFGCLEEWTGVHAKYELCGDPRDFTMRWADGTESTGGIWYDAFEANGADVLATYIDVELDGLAAITRSRSISANRGSMSSGRLRVGLCSR